MKRLLSIAQKVNWCAGYFFLGGAIGGVIRRDWHCILFYLGSALFFFWYSAYAIPQMKRWLKIE